MGECGFEGMVPCISNSSQHAYVKLLSIKNKELAACSRGCMVTNGGGCMSPRNAFCIKAGKNIIHFLPPDDLATFWRTQYAAPFLLPTEDEYAQSSKAGYDPDLRQICQWKTGAPRQVIDGKVAWSLVRKKRR